MNQEQEIIYNQLIDKYFFNESKKEEIRLGIENGIDVSIYAKPEFYYRQMDVIYSGLEKNIDVSIYANPEFTAEQMEQIRLGLQEGLNVSIYANKKYNGEEMKEILFSLLNSNFKIKTSTKIKMFIQKIKGN